MRTLRLLGLTTGLLMWAMSPVWAEGPEFPLRTDGPPCVLQWGLGDRFNVYVSPTPGSTGALVATIPATGLPPGILWNVPCPLQPGQYYMAVTTLLGLAESAPAFAALVITDPSAPVGFTIGAAVKVAVPLIYVRASPSPTGLLLAFVGKGATGVIREGPVTAGGQTWWRVQYTPTLLGWSAQAVLSL